jgi:hypothetical protein
LQSKTILCWPGTAIRLAIAANSGGNYIAARVAFDHGVDISTLVALDPSRH